MRIVAHRVTGDPMMIFGSWTDRVANSQVGDYYDNEGQIYVVYGVGETGIAIRELEGEQKLHMLRQSHVPDPADMPRRLRASEGKYARGI